MTHVEISAARICEPADLARASEIGRFALRSLYAELVLYPKPGLVSLRDNGAHSDMNATTFMRSLFALRHYFSAIARLGMEAKPMAQLRRLGIDAEARMLAATGGVNTHRGAIFALGLLCAVAGRAWQEGIGYGDGSLRELVARHWRRDLVAVCVGNRVQLSHGMQAMARYGVAGARGEAVQAFPSVFEIALPALRMALARGIDEARARLHAFFFLLANVCDTNVLHRGGRVALQRLQARAGDFIAAGSVFADDWHNRAEVLHRHCSRTGISPGGCADLLAAAWFVHLLQTQNV